MRTFLEPLIALAALVIAPGPAAAQPVAVDPALAEPGRVVCPPEHRPRIAMDGVAICERVPVIVAPPAPSPTKREWVKDGEARIVPELSAFGGLAGLRSHSMYGGGISVGFRRVSTFDDRPLAKTDDYIGIFAALFSFGITAVPRDVWFGNEYGLDLRVSVVSAQELNARVPALPGAHAPTIPVQGDPFARVFLGVAPAFRITRDPDPFRFPAVFQLVPELGAALNVGGSPEFFVRVHPLPLSALVAPHVAFELDPSLTTLVPNDGSKPRSVFALNFGLVLR